MVFKYINLAEKEIFCEEKPIIDEIDKNNAYHMLRILILKVNYSQVYSLSLHNCRLGSNVSSLLFKTFTLYSSSPSLMIKPDRWPFSLTIGCIFATLSLIIVLFKDRTTSAIMLSLYLYSLFSSLISCLGCFTIWNFGLRFFNNDLCLLGEYSLKISSRIYV